MWNQDRRRLGGVSNRGCMGGWVLSGKFDDQKPLWNLVVVSGGVFSVKFNQKITPARIFFLGNHKPKKLLWTSLLSRLCCTVASRSSPSSIYQSPRPILITLSTYQKLFNLKSRILWMFDQMVTVAYAMGSAQGSCMAVWCELYNENFCWPDWYQKVFHKIKGALAHIKVDSPAPCPKAHWMSMPSTGEVMANAFKRPVFYLSDTFCQTFLPSFCPPQFLLLFYMIFLILSPCSYITQDSFRPLILWRIGKKRHQKSFGDGKPTFLIVSNWL
jgi:hypothetical protein